MNKRIIMAYNATKGRERNDELYRREDAYRIGNDYYGGYNEPIMDRYRDSQGRQHYDNGRYAPQNRQYYIVTDGPYRQEVQEMARGREYEPMRAPQMRYDPYEGDYMANTYKPVMGFAGSTTMHYGYPQIEEMGNLNGTMERGYANHGESYPKLNRKIAEEWVKGMKNGDGSIGEHWGFDQTTQLMRQRNIECDPVEFYAAINMMYSDYYHVAKALNVNSVDFYAKMAEAFLCDADAVKDKMARYYAVIPA